MKRNILSAALVITFLLMITPQRSFALGLEIGLGYWQQGPSGSILNSGDVLTGTKLDLESDLNYDTENRFFGRIKVELPLFLPNIYVMATPMKFEESGQTTFNINFGDQTIQANIPFESTLKLDHYDIALYYSLPFIRTATLDKLNIELGLNARFIDFEMEIIQQSAGISEKESETVVLPMGYIGIQISPMESFSIEAEGRGVAYSSNHYFDLIVRLKVKPFGPFFISAGYRYQDIDIDESDVEVNIEFKGPFAEAGLSF